MHQHANTLHDRALTTIASTTQQYANLLHDRALTAIPNTMDLYANPHNDRAPTAAASTVQPDANLLDDRALADMVSAMSLSRKTLQDMPAETRNAIWRLIVVKEQPINLLRRSGRPAQRSLNFRPRILTQVSRQVRIEVLAVYFAENTFCLSYDSDRRLLSSITALQRECGVLFFQQIKKFDVFMRVTQVIPGDANTSVLHTLNFYFIAQRHAARLEFKFRKWTEDDELVQYCICILEPKMEKWNKVGGNGLRLAEVVNKASSLVYRKKALVRKCDECERPLLEFTVEDQKKYGV